MQANVQLWRHKSTVKPGAAILLALFAFVIFLSACSAESKDEESLRVQEPSLPLEAYNGEFLHGDIPAPTGADVFILANSTDEEFDHYSFTFENFTLQEAKDYITLLEESVVEKREVYDVYTENDYPMLNYFGWLKDGSAITLSQCDTSGGITINAKKAIISN